VQNAMKVTVRGLRVHIIPCFSERREADKVWGQGRSFRGYAAKHVKNLAVHVRSRNWKWYDAVVLKLAYLLLFFI